MVLTKMGCCLKSGVREHSPNSRVHVEIVHFVRGSSIVSLSHNRIDFVHVRYGCSGYVEIVWSFPSFSFRIPDLSKKCWKPQTSPRLFCKQQAFRIQIQKIPIIHRSPLLRQVSPRFHPSIRQGIHLSVALENSTLPQVSNFFSSYLSISLES